MIFTAVKDLVRCMQSCGGKRTEREYKLNTSKFLFFTKNYEVDGGCSEMNRLSLKSPWK